MHTLYSETDDRFYVAPSTIPGAGHGLFAEKDLEIGEMLKIIGVRIPAGSISDLCTRFADEHKFRMGDFLVIPLGLAAMVNHSRTPNMKKIIENEEVYLKVIQRVAAGEELFFGYGEYALERFGLKDA